MNDWKQQSLDYLDRIQSLANALKAKIRTLETENLAKETRLELHDLEAAIYGLEYAINKLEMFPCEQKKSSLVCGQRE